MVGDLVLFNTLNRIYAFDLRTGTPAGRCRAIARIATRWAKFTPAQSSGRPRPIRRGERPQERRRTAVYDDGRRPPALCSARATGHRPRARSRLFDRQKVIWSVWIWLRKGGWCGEFRKRRRRRSLGIRRLAGLRRNNVYVAMRYNDVQPQEHVACYDAQTGTLRWRRLICAAESPARGQAEEITNNLLTLDHDTLYLNTNLGAVAAIATTDGQIRWLSLYPRAKEHSGGIDPPANFYRDLNPCVLLSRQPVCRPDRLRRPFCRWTARRANCFGPAPPPRDVVHLLGVGGGNLLASGQRLWWLNVDSGKVVYRWPDQTTVHGYGRGALVGDHGLFPDPHGDSCFSAIARLPASRRQPGGPLGRFVRISETRESGRLDMRDPLPFRRKSDRRPAAIC